MNAIAQIKARAAAKIQNEYVSHKAFQRLVRQLKIVAKAEGKSVEQVVEELS